MEKLVDEHKPTHIYDINFPYVILEMLLATLAEHYFEAR